MTVTVEVITTSEGLADLAPIWGQLVCRAGLTHPFLTHEWIRTWWECFGGDAELCVLLVCADGEPIAIAPLMRTTERIYGKSSRCLRLLANDHTPRCDFIIAARPDDVYTAIWNFLMDGSRDWDMVLLRELPADSRTSHEFTRRAAEGGTLSGHRQSTHSPFLPTTSEWNRYVESLPKKRRWSLRTWLKRLAALGDVLLETVTGEPNLRDALEDGFRLEGTAWKEKAGTAIRSAPDVRRFYTLLAERAAARGWLRLQFLRVGDRRIAFAYCLAFEQRMYLLKTGFDAQYAAYSPGTLLCYLALQETFASGFVAYDFLGDDDQWKRRWATETATHNWLFLYASRPWSRLAHYAKFAIIPALQQSPLYVRIRDRMFGSTT
jgi:CelD/BcsL family acetyltransferase involved in cellulose biosynthesis